MSFDFTKRRPIGTSRMDCEIAQRVNEMILKGEPPEDPDLIAQVIAHTALCDLCRGIFLASNGRKEEEAPD